MHAHNPEQMRCADARCRERAVGYCADAPFQLGLGPLCQTHLMEHRRLGHDVRFVDGGACGVCNGRGEVASQAADAETPGGRWVRCLQCQGSGYIDEETLDRGRRRAAEREQARQGRDLERAGSEGAGSAQEQAQRKQARREQAWREREQAQREQAQQGTGSATWNRPSGIQGSAGTGSAEQAQRGQAQRRAGRASEAACSSGRQR